MVTLTREQLYSRAWDQPMRALAGEFGLSDVALHKICRKHSIPTPPVGYWAKKVHGKRVTVTPLPRAKDGTDTPIVIHEGAASHESEAMSATRLLVRERLAANKETAADLNASVERTLAKLAKAKRYRLGFVQCEGKGMITARVRPDSIKRAWCILAQLVAVSERAGFALDACKGPAFWRVNGKTIGFELVEIADKVPHVPTEKELAALAKWKREHEDHHRRYGYWRDWGEPKIPKWEERYQGRLAIRLEEVRIRSERSWWGTAIRRQFADRKNRDVRKDIPRIVETVAAIAVAKRENREFEERQRLEAAERERQRLEAERRGLLEEKRVQMLEQLLSEQAEVEQLETLVRLLENSPERFPRVEGLLGWTRERLARKTYRLSPVALEERLAQAKLFDQNQAAPGSINPKSQEGGGPSIARAVLDEHEPGFA